MSLEKFKAKFRFSPPAGLVGVEQEAFLVDQDGHVVPRSPDLVRAANGEHSWLKPELSACQVECVTAPTRPEDLAARLQSQQVTLRALAGSLGLRVAFKPVAPAEMPLTVYKSIDHFKAESKRYNQIATLLSPETLQAGCRVAGLHVHVGMPDHKSALAAYNRAVRHVDRLIELGCQSERLAIYKHMPLQWRPTQYNSWYDFYRFASFVGFANNPRDNWALIRLSVHGTIEFRMFDTTDDTDQIMDLVWSCVRATQ